MLHYHRRNNISLLCSEWEQVVLLHYDCQEKLVKIKKSFFKSQTSLSIGLFYYLRSSKSIKRLRNQLGMYG